MSYPTKHLPCEAADPMFTNPPLICIDHIDTANVYQDPLRIELRASICLGQVNANRMRLILSTELGDCPLHKCTNSFTKDGAVKLKCVCTDTSWRKAIFELFEAEDGLL
jgi:hypothetical protein